MSQCPPPPPPPGTPPPPPGWITGDACFPGNTLIPTDQGAVQIKDLTPDHSIRKNHVSQVVRAINVVDYMIMFDKDSLGPNMPDKDLLISRNHRIFFNKKKTRAEDMINGVSIRKHHTGHDFMYNVQLRKFAYIRCNNLMVETYR
jgi:hypothetical protein